MSCYDPILACVCTRRDGTRFTRLGIQSGVPLDSNGRPACDSFTTFDGYPAYPVLLPCGHCLGCRSDQAKVWSNRLLMESLYHDSAFFVTLTYDDFHVPRYVNIDDETGEYVDRLTLCKRDVQLFNKRLRKAYSQDKIRFYLCGEYGPQTQRPHYHAIYFGLHVDDLVPSGRSETGNQYYESEKIFNVWERKGYVSIEPANEFTFKYVANYVTKKLGAKSNDYYLSQHIEPPFSLCSRRPGIGYQYLTEHRDELLGSDRVIIGTDRDSYQFSPPRYFYQKLEEEGVDIRDLRRRHRVSALDRADCIDRETDLMPLVQLDVKEYNHAQRLKKRDGV